MKISIFVDRIWVYPAPRGGATVKLFAPGREEVEFTDGNALYAGIWDTLDDFAQWCELESTNPSIRIFVRTRDRMMQLERENRAYQRELTEIGTFLGTRIAATDTELAKDVHSPAHWQLECWQRLDRFIHELFEARQKGVF